MIGCYRSEKDRFGDTFEEDWSHTLVDYEGRTEFFGRNRTQKFQFLSVDFRGDGGTFYKSKVKKLQI